VDPGDGNPPVIALDSINRTEFDLTAPPQEFICNFRITDDTGFNPASLPEEPIPIQILIGDDFGGYHSVYGNPPSKGSFTRIAGDETDGRYEYRVNLSASTLPNYADLRGWKSLLVSATDVSGATVEISFPNAFEVVDHSWISWQAANGVTSLMEDGDHDGVTAFEEWAFMLNPTTKDQAKLPTLSLGNDIAKLSWSGRRVTGRNEALFIPEFSSDLIHWESAPAFYYFYSPSTYASMSAVDRYDAASGPRYARVRVLRPQGIEAAR
jgi:hypothetical protein